MSSPSTEVKVLAWEGTDNPAVSCAYRAGWCPPTISWPDRGWKLPTGTSWVQSFSDCINEQSHLSHDINTRLLDSTVRWLELLQFLAEWEHKEWLFCFTLLAHSPHVLGRLRGDGAALTGTLCPWDLNPDPALSEHGWTGWTLPALLVPTSLRAHIPETGFQVPCHMLCSWIFLMLLLFSTD